MKTPGYMRIVSLSCLTVILTAGHAYAQSPALLSAIKITENEQFEKASSAYKALIAKDATNAENYFYYGESLFASEKTDSALTLFKKGVEVNPKMPLNYIGLAKVYRVQGKMSEAETNFNTAFNLFNEKGVKIKDEMKARTYIEGAEAMLEGSPKNPAKSIELADKALALDERAMNAYLVKGDALFESDPLNATPSITVFKTAIQLDNKSANAYSRLAYMYYRGGKNLYPKSLEYYTTAITNDANFAPAYKGRAKVNYYLNKPEDAITDMKKYLELNPGSNSARKENIHFLVYTKRYDEALTEISSLEKVMGADDPSLNRLKAYALFAKEDYAGAQKAMEVFMKAKPDKVNADDNEYMGRILMKTGGDEVLMNQYFVKAVGNDIRSRAALITDVIGYYDTKKNDRMVALWYKRKVDGGSKDANDLYYGGGAAKRANMLGLADTLLSQYVIITPDFAPTWFQLFQVKEGIDTADVKTWAAKDAATTYITKVKPEELEKNKNKLAEVYYFFARYYYISDKKDIAVAKCWANKMVALTPNEFWTKTAENFLKQPDVAKATAAAECN